MIREDFLKLGEYAAAGLYEEPERGLFYRKALGLRRFYENCELAIYGGEHLYPSGVIEQKMNITPNYLTGLQFASSEFNEQSPHLALKLKEEFCAYRSTVPAEHTVAGNMFTHSMPHYERILKEGFLPQKTHNKAIQKAIESYRLTQNQKEFLRSLKIK